VTAGRCAECGFEFEPDRAGLAARCAEFPRIVTELLASVTDDRLRRRPAAGTWAPIEYAAHVAEALHWYRRRIQRVRDEDVPQLTPYDFDAAADAGDYRNRAIGEVTADVASACSQLAGLVSTLGDIELHRCGRGSDGSVRSVASLLARAHHELVHHELDLRRGVTPGWVGP
jgi:DinB superfamily